MTLPPDTSRLRFRALTLADTDALFELVGDAESMRYYPRVYDRDGAVGWIERQISRYEKNGVGLWACEFKDSGEFAGLVGLVVTEVDGVTETEVGWLILRKYWKQGLATEAAQSCLDYGFNRLGLNRLIALIRPINLPSARVAEKLGMRIEKQVIHFDFVHDVWV